MTPETTITGLPTASGIDAATDWLPIDRTSLNTTQKINRNTLLGITSQPVGISDSQTLTNKTLTQPIITVDDDDFTVQDNVDTTKKLQFQLSGITTATTRTLTIPNANTTIVGTDATQTLTNKTLTSPIITNGSITGTTITTDAIVGQTAATNGTVYGISVTSGTIGGAALASNSISTVKLQDGSVTAPKLSTSAILLANTSVSGLAATTTSLTPVQQTGFNTAATIPSGGRSVEITVYVPFMYNANSGSTVFLTLWSGTFGSGNALAYAQFLTAGANNGGPVTLTFVHTPTAGAINYSVGLHVGGGTGGIQSTGVTGGTARLIVKAI